MANPYDNQEKDLNCWSGGLHFCRGGLYERSKIMANTDDRMKGDCR